VLSLASWSVLWPVPWRLWRAWYRPPCGQSRPIAAGIPVRGAKVLDDANRVLAPPRPVLRGSGPSDDQPGGPDEQLGGVARYLRPEEAVVSFRDRPELAMLRAWLVSKRRTDVQLVTGAGGAGKTRLAIELSEEAVAQYGWRSYWVRPGEEAQAASAAAGSDMPVLLVVDYAETLAGLAALLAEVTRDGPARSVRVLLLGPQRRGVVGSAGCRVRHVAR
jgi:hypothetical protein